MCVAVHQLFTLLSSTFQKTIVGVCLLKILPQCGKPKLLVVIFSTIYRTFLHSCLFSIFIIDGYTL